MCVDLFFLIHQVFNKTESLACMCLTELLSYSLILKVQKKNTSKMVCLLKFDFKI